jgi:2-amino-4-hydroxy-6-hydroxymethyldihydropteridine diphosphokinase
MSTNVLIAIGSNRRHRCGTPQAVVAAAIVALQAAGLRLRATSRARTTLPLGPGGRAYANAAVAVETELTLPALLALLKAIERRFGRRGGQRWGARALDLDILAAADTVYPSITQWLAAARGLLVPHRALADRSFVLDPLIDIAPDWRHPVLHLSARQLRARHARPRAVCELGP